tara:strand:- start:88 stop:849 length:762 start_codon:yes stop_codon:yes gene_type:complete
LYRSVNDIKDFYRTREGYLVQRVISSAIAGFWDDVHGLRVMGCGYTIPFLDQFKDEAERIIAVMPSGQGACLWPKDKKNAVCMAYEDSFPLENNAMDRILLVHYLECAEDLRICLREVWRVLKPNGRLMVVVPNRGGFWAHADWSPFGQGSPFSHYQLNFYMKDNLFSPLRSKGALYTPPFHSRTIQRFSNTFEYLGKTVIPIAAGVYVAEFKKEVYAKIDDKGSGSAVFAKTKEILRGRKPVAGATRDVAWV